MNLASTSSPTDITKSGVFNTRSRAGIGGTNVTFYAFSQVNGGTLGINGSHFALNDSTFLVIRQVLIERIFFDLLHAQRDTFTLWIDLQNNGGDLVTLLELTNCVFAQKLFQEMSDR